MRLRSIFGTTAVAITLVLVGCDGMTVNADTESDEAVASQKTVSNQSVVFDAEEVALQAMALFSASKARPRPTIWADEELFGSVVAPNAFKPTSGNFDELYTGGNGFLNGVPLISESKPGDQDYNGGRWHVNVLKEGVDPDKYANADSVDDLDLADFMSTDVYFSCPMLPRRGQN